MHYWFKSYSNFAGGVDLHREGSAPAACAAGWFCVAVFSGSKILRKKHATNEIERYVKRKEKY